MKAKVTAKINSNAKGADLPSIFDPHAICVSAVLITIRIGHGQNVEVKAVNEITVFFAIYELIDHECACCMSYPLPGVNTFSYQV